MTTRPFNVRMDDDLKHAIRRRVDAGEASNQSEWAREALAGVDALGGLSALARAIELVGGDTSHGPHPARAMQLQRTPVIRQRPLVECPHPEGQQVRTPFSVRCTVCGTTIGSTTPDEPPPPPKGARVLGQRVTTPDGEEPDILALAQGPAPVE